MTPDFVMVADEGGDSGALPELEVIAKAAAFDAPAQMDMHAWAELEALAAQLRAEVAVCVRQRKILMLALEMIVANAEASRVLGYDPSAEDIARHALAEAILVGPESCKLEAAG